MRYSALPTFDPAAYGQVVHAPAYREVQSQLVIELRRARRYERALSVALVGLQAPTRGRGEIAGGATPTVYGLLGSYLRNVLRETDILTAVPDLLAYAVFLPETDWRGAERLLERFRRGFLECSGLALRGGVAGFPTDGLTIEDLLERARVAWHQESRCDDVPMAKPRQSHG